MAHKLIRFDYELKQWRSTTLGWVGKIWSLDTKLQFPVDGEEKLIAKDVVQYKIEYAEFIMLKTSILRVKLMRTEEVKDGGGI